MGEVVHLGWRFYTDRVDPREWVYEDYLAEVEALAAARVAQGLRDDYRRETRAGFAAYRAKRIWGVPEPPPDLSGAIEALRKLKKRLEDG